MSITEMSAFKISCNWLGFTPCCMEKSHPKDRNTTNCFQRRSVAIRVSILLTDDIEEVLTDIILMLASIIKLVTVLKPRKQKGKEK